MPDNAEAQKTLTNSISTSSNLLNDNEKNVQIHPSPETNTINKKPGQRRKNRKAKDCSSEKFFKKAANYLVTADGEGSSESLLEILSEHKPIDDTEWEAIKRFYACNEKVQSRKDLKPEDQQVRRKKKFRKKSEQVPKSDADNQTSEEGHKKQANEQVHEPQLDANTNSAYEEVSYSVTCSIISDRTDAEPNLLKSTSSKSSSALLDKKVAGRNHQETTSNDILVIDCQTHDGGNPFKQIKSKKKSEELISASFEKIKKLKEVEEAIALHQSTTIEKVTTENKSTQQKRAKKPPKERSNWTPPHPLEKPIASETGDCASAPSKYPRSLSVTSKSCLTVSATKSLFNRQERKSDLASVKTAKSKSFNELTCSLRKCLKKEKNLSTKKDILPRLEKLPQPAKSECKQEIIVPQVFGDSHDKKQSEVENITKNRKFFNSVSAFNGNKQAEVRQICLKSTGYEEKSQNRRKTQSNEVKGESSKSKEDKQKSGTAQKKLKKQRNQQESVEVTQTSEKNINSSVENDSCKQSDTIRKKGSFIKQEQEKLLKNLDPGFRRAMFWEYVKEHCCSIFISLLSLILLLSLLLGFSFIAVYSGIYGGNPITTTTSTLPTSLTTTSTPSPVIGHPLAPISGTLHVINQPKQNQYLRKFAGQWRKSLDSVKWSQTVLSSALVEIYEEAGLPTDGIFVTNLAFSTNPKQRVIVFRNRRTKPVVIDYTIYPRSRRNGPLVLTDLVRHVRLALNKKKWLYDPREFVLTQGNFTARAVTLQSFLSNDFPIFDLHSPPTNPSSKIVYNKTCPRLFMNSNVQVLPLNCKLNHQSLVNQTCRFFCEDGHILAGDKYRVCLASGVWSGQQATCVKYCPALQLLNHGQILPPICSNVSSNEGIPSFTRCIYYCDSDYRLFGTFQRQCKVDGTWTYNEPVCKRECPMLGQPIFGKVSPAKCSTERSLEGDVCTFSCLDGYSLQGEATSSCDHAGRWSQEVPGCRKTCQPLQPVRNADVHPVQCIQTKLFEGTSCSFYCLDGFVLRGPKFRSCVGDDIWTEEAPECIPVCKALREIAHGNVTPISCSLSSQVVFSKCFFACDDGFVLEGKQVLTCFENGLWNEKQPVCLAQCPSLQTPDNGLLQCNSSKHNSTCILHCLKSYQLRGAKMVTCRNNGIWSEPIGACLETCPKIDAPAHGYVTPDQCSLIESTVNSTCTFSCEKSFSISGSLSTQCMHTRSWSDTQAVCLQDNHFFLVLMENEFQVCLTAKAGSYFPAKQDLRQCVGKSFDYWSLYEESLIKNAGTGLCIGFDQPAEMAKLVFLSCDLKDKRQMWTFNSSEVTLRMLYYPFNVWYGYSSAFEVIATAQRNSLSSWMLFNPDTLSKSTFYAAVLDGHCPRLSDLPNGLWYPDSCSRSPLPNGAICTFVCAPGYVGLDESSVVMCELGNWIGIKQPSCFTSCPTFNSSVIDASNLGITPQECFFHDFVKRGTTCSFKCKTNFVLIGEQNTVCLTNGQWSSPIPKCAQLCPPIISPTKGKILSTKSCKLPLVLQKVGSVCEIHCNEGFVINGSNIFECLANGTWNVTSSTCVRACNKPDSPFMGQVICPEERSLFPILTSCIYNCSAGRTLHPYIPNITCLSSGTWNNYPPACQNFCPSLLPIENGYIKPSACTEFESTFPNEFICSYSCKLNYTLNGEKELKCSTSGAWSSSPPVCKPDFHFLLTHESNREPLICLIADNYSYYNKRLVAVVPFAQCNRWNPLHVWTLISLNRIQNVGTGLCLAVAELNDGEKVVLSKCGNEYYQQWESFLEDQFAVIRLHQSSFILQYQNTYVFVSKTYEDQESISWTTQDLLRNIGTLTGMQRHEHATCPLLSLPSSTSINPPSCKSLVKVGSSCRITCETNYQLRSGNSSATLFCGEFGLWNTLDIYCKRRKCPPLPLPPPNTIISEKECTAIGFPAFYSKDCAYSCDKGFYLDLPGGSTGILRCLGNGMWSEPVPKCIQFCKPFKVFRNVNVIPNTICTNNEKAAHEQVCAFSCNPHFYLKGSQFLQCKSGTWNGTEPRCIEISGKGRCKGFRSVNHANLKPFICYSTNVPQKTVCHIVCNVGYSLVPSTYNEVVCQANGKWSLPLPKCRKTCDLIEGPLHSHFEPESCRTGVITVGEKCYIVCDRGYALTSGKGQVVCLETGFFTETSDLCESKQQFMIQSVNDCAYASSDDKSLVYFKTCALNDLSQWWEWIDNSRIRNVKTHKCLAPEEMKSYARGNLVNCRKLGSFNWECPFSSNSNEGLVFNKRFYMAKAKSSFPSILFVVDPNEDDSSWISNRTTSFYGAGIDNVNARPCLFRPSFNCPLLPHISNGAIEDCKIPIKNIIPGTTCTYTCNEKYLLQGQATRSCQENGEWTDGNKPQCKITCLPLYVPKFANISPKNCKEERVAEGTFCTFSCDPGFSLVGSSRRFCQQDSTWSGLPAVCYQPCPALKLAPMLDISPSSCALFSQEIGTVCTASCPFGYSLVGDSFSECLFSGEWSGQIVGCQQSCNPLDKVANGKLLPSNCNKPGKYNGSVCTVECDEHYGIQGSRTRTCTSDGLWTGFHAKCLRKCKPLSAPYNGLLECNHKLPLEGDSCRFSCNLNYVIAEKNNIRVCLKDGQWSGEDVTCEHESQFKIVQGSPNNIESCLAVTPRNIVTVTSKNNCNFANQFVRWAWLGTHMIRHTNTRLCLAGNISSVGSHLILKKCNNSDADQIWECSDPKKKWFIRLAQHQLYPLHSPISTHYVLLFDKESLDFILNNSFVMNRLTQWYATTLSTARISICLLRQLDSCKPLKVFPRTILAPVSCSFQNMPTGTMCYISCPTNYKLNRHIVATECMLGGRWSHAMPKCITSCDSFSLPNFGALTVNPPTCSGSYRHPENFICRFSCPPNMRLVGNPMLTCQRNSKWNYPAPQCIATCPALNSLQHSKIVPESCTVIGTKHLENTTCRYECLQPEHVVKGSAVRTCKSSGLWDGSDVKCVKSCPIIFPIAGGFIRPQKCLSQHSIAGDVCEFSCFKNLIQQGPGYTICLPNGTWTGERPRCQITCPKLPIPTNAIVKPSSCVSAPTLFGQQCIVSCDSEFQIEGNDVTECLEDRNWSQPLGKCIRKCKKLLKPLNSQVEPKSCVNGYMRFGQECTFSCEYGFILQGSSTRLCLNNGSWSGLDTKCAIACSPIGPGLNIDFSPRSCGNQLQVEETVCRATCKSGMKTRYGLVSSEVTCIDKGHWNKDSIRACYPICDDPVIANGKVECTQHDGLPTAIFTTSTTCMVVCDQNYVVSNVSESKCETVNIQNKLPKWTPVLATCEYESNTMIIINRVQYEGTCLGVEQKKIVLFEWQQCKNESRNTQWVWYNEFQIQNTGTGNCMEASQLQSNSFVTSSRCDVLNRMQQWTCNNEDPYLLRLVDEPLYINIAIKDIQSVLLTDEKQKYSKLYTYNPQSERNYGTLCSQRSLHRKGDICILPHLPKFAKFSRKNCFSSNGIKVGSFCTVICNTKLTTTIECQPDGLWKPPIESLCKNRCQPFDGLKANAKFLERNCKSKSNSFGTFCSLDCDDGYVLVGNSNGTNCTYGGRWTPMENYTCARGCPEIDSVENGITIPNKCLTGVCSLMCAPGFRISGSKTRTCMNNGQWSGTDFSCIANKQFSIVSSLKFKLHSLCLEAFGYADVVKAKCSGTRKIQQWRWNSQFTIENVVTRRCLAVATSQVRIFEYSQNVALVDKGSFINTEASNYIATKSFNDANNVIPIRLFNNGQRNVITKVCDTTDFTQRWNCRSEKDLFLHLVEREVYLDSGALFRSNIEVSKTTTRKSIKWLGRFHGKEKSVCAYRSLGTCQALNDLPNGFVDLQLCKSNYVQVGTRCTYSCEDGYTIYGHKSTICLNNGKWSELPPTCLGKSRCTALQSYSHLLIEPYQCSFGRVLEGQVCKVACSSGTHMQGNSQLVCLDNGNWSHSVPSCDTTCPAIHPPSLGFVSPKQCEKEFNQPSFVCALQCMINRSLTGAVNWTCLADGSWEGQEPACEHFCPPLGKIKNGEINPKRCSVEASATGDVCWVECDFGFSLFGKASLACINGKWSAQLPSCKNDQCKRLIPSRGTRSLDYSGLINGAIVASSVVNINCNFGFKTKAFSAKVCLPDGKWSGGSETCKQIRCPPLPKLYKGFVSPHDCTESSIGLTVGTVCYFTCETGFLLEGATSKECKFGGEWGHPEYRTSCLDTLPKVQPATFLIQVLQELAFGDVMVKCLESSKGDDGLYLEECDDNNFFQHWKWLGTTQLKSIGSQTCLKLGKLSKAKKKATMMRNLNQETCVVNNTEAIRCGNINSKTKKFQLIIGNTTLGSTIIGGLEKLFLVTWSGKWIDYTRSRNYQMKPQINIDPTPICSFMCGGNIIADEGDLSTPNYPYEYPSNIHCLWVIEAKTSSREMLLDFSYMNFDQIKDGSASRDECLYDYVEIFEEQGDGANFLKRFCSATMPIRFVTLHGRFRLVFHSDNLAVGKRGTGWAAHWWSRRWPAPNDECGKLNTSSNLPVMISQSSLVSAPWQVLVIYRERDLCNGVVYDSHFVITSASCIESFYNRSSTTGDQQVLIMYGFQSQANLVKRYQQKDFNSAKRIWLHPKYSRSYFKNNLALVMTRKTIKFGAAIQPICFPSIKIPHVAVLGYSKCWAVQWSRDFFSHHHSKWEFTRYSYVLLLNSDECMRILQSHKNLKTRKKLICAKEAKDLEPVLSSRPILSKHEDDEGNILQCSWNTNWYLVGISSFTFIDDYDELVIVYTDVRVHNEWISDITLMSHYMLRDEYLNTFH